MKLQIATVEIWNDTGILGSYSTGNITILRKVYISIWGLHIL
jgi:hypothetical protein